MTTIFAALAILLVSIPCTCLLGIVLAGWDICERYSVFFEAYETTFLVVMASLKKMSLGLESVDF